MAPDGILIASGDASSALTASGGPERIDPLARAQGALNISYKLGPSLGVSARLVVTNHFQKSPVWNVIGSIPGSLPAELDQPVLLGNHRDAWVYGAADPNSGTAQLIEVARGLGALLRSGWKPKRTLIFTSWSGEEYGLLGSTAWGEVRGARANARARLESGWREWPPSGRRRRALLAVRGRLPISTPPHIHIRRRAARHTECEYSTPLVRVRVTDETTARRSTLRSPCSSGPSPTSTSTRASRAPSLAPRAHRRLGASSWAPWAKSTTRRPGDRSRMCGTMAISWPWAPGRTTPSSSITSASPRLTCTSRPHRDRLVRPATHLARFGAPSPPLAPVVARSCARSRPSPTA